MKTVTWKRMNGERVQSHVKRRVDYSDMCAIAIAVKDKVFEGGGYRPYRRDLDYVWQVLASYTDIQFDDVNEMMEEYEYGELGQLIRREIDNKQLDYIQKLTDDMVCYERNKGGMDRLGALLAAVMAKSMAEADKTAAE